MNRDSDIGTGGGLHLAGADRPTCAAHPSTGTHHHHHHHHYHPHEFRHHYLPAHQPHFSFSHPEHKGWITRILVTGAQNPLNLQIWIFLHCLGPFKMVAQTVHTFN